MRSRRDPPPTKPSCASQDGTLDSSTHRIGNLDGDAAASAYRAFLGRATTSHADLVLTPEYSVPWLVFNDIVQGNRLPPTGALWALGFESITPAEFRALKVAVDAAAQPTILLHEPLDAREEQQKTFMDPLLYLFWARDDDTREDVLCALVQFKTIGSRDPNHIERDHLYLGTTIYKFTSAANPIALIGLICSDAFEFTDRVNDHHDSLLLLHIQLNQKPSHAAYARYRQRMFDIASNSRVEFLCLNWAAGVTCDDKIWSDIAGSMWCISPLSQPPTDADVDSLHNQGIYYSLVSERWHGYYLNYRPHALLLRKSPVFVEGQQVLAQHTAPEVIERLGWDPDSETWVAEPADDGFTAFIGGYQALNGSLPALRDQSALAVERALELLAGPPGRPYSWHALSELESLTSRAAGLSEVRHRMPRGGPGPRGRRVQKAPCEIGTVCGSSTW